MYIRPHIVDEIISHVKDKVFIVASIIYLIVYTTIIALVTKYQAPPSVLLVFILGGSLWWIIITAIRLYFSSDTIMRKKTKQLCRIADKHFNDIDSMSVHDYTWIEETVNEHPEYKNVLHRVKSNKKGLIAKDFINFYFELVPLEEKRRNENSRKFSMEISKERAAKKELVEKNIL